jgi:hypothetical protein
MSVVLGPFSLDRMERAVEKVRQRLLRAAAALEGAGVPYAIAGGNAVALWVSRVDEAAVRNTRDVDVLIRRGDFPAARAALEAAGFVYRHAGGLNQFLDGPSEAVRVIFAREKVREHEPAANPDVTESEQTDQFRVLSLAALVRIKLTAFRDKDRTHLRDMIEIGLIDETWLSRLPGPLAERLKQLLDDPNG